jgi:hypothetical protein
LVSTVGTRLDVSVQIAVLDPLRAVNRALLELIDGFDADDWNCPTVHKDRSVKDLTAHLLHGSIRRVSGMRGGYRPSSARTFSTAEDLTRFISQRLEGNRSGNRRFA